jgi:hypothetical protein
MMMAATHAALLRACKGNVVKLFRNPCSSAVVADIYDELPAAERNAMVAEFYSREFALLGGAQSAAGRIANLVTAWKHLEGAKRRSIMKYLIMSLTPIVEKAYVDPSAIHRYSSLLHRPVHQQSCALCQSRDLHVPHMPHLSLA